MAVLLLIFDRKSKVGFKVCDAVGCKGTFLVPNAGGV